MSTLETNSIGKYSGNNVSIDDALNLKSYDTAGRDALTSVAGDTIYNTTTGKVEYYNGSAWVETGASSFNIDYLVIAGGGSGGTGNGTGGAGGGAGGYLNSYASENSGGATSSRDTFSAFAGQTYKVKVGGGGASVSSNTIQGNLGTNSNFDFIVSYGGGAGGKTFTPGGGGGSGGGGGAHSAAASGAGGSGVVILRWATADATIGATRTGLVDGGVQTDGSDSYIVFTGGEGDITFS